MTEHTHVSSKTNIWEDWERTTSKAKATGSPGQEISQVDYSHPSHVLKKGHTSQEN